MTLLGAAFGGGILLSAMLGGRRNRRVKRGFYNPAPALNPVIGTDHQKHKALETWDNIKGALIGVAATRFKDFVGEVVPGFHEHFQRTEEKIRASQPPSR